MSRPVRVALAVAATRAVNAASRRTGHGSGTVAGGRVGLGLYPGMVRSLAAGRPVGLVSGTNGKTTTTRLLAAALEGAGAGPVVSNVTGANMPAGHAAALAAGPPAGPVVLEVDEGYLAATVADTDPRVVVLLNLSRDQLDRTNEVRRTAGAWRAALGPDGPEVVANADDPLVAWAAGGARTTWVAAGIRWREDAVGCPACGGRIEFDQAGWACPCGFARPEPGVALDDAEAGATVRWADGRTEPLGARLPGRFNRANTLMAAVAATVMGVPWEGALAGATSVEEVAGRFARATVGGVPTRLLLAKNPAGWAELLALVARGDLPVVVAINARIADGRDPSWLWDVPFEQLAGRPVVATGERRLDLAVRLRHAGVAHQLAEDPQAAVRLAAGAADANGPGAEVEFIGNYTAFDDLRRAAAR